MSPEPADRDRVVSECREIMHRSEAVYVTTLDDDGMPCTRAVFNLRREEQFPDLSEVFATDADPLVALVATNTSSEKVRQLRRDPRVALYYCLPSTFHGVMLSGRVVEIADARLKERIYQPGWEIYYPAGPGDPDYTLLRLDPTRARGWLFGTPFDVRFRGDA